MMSELPKHPENLSLFKKERTL